jgi:hypothetical protein
MAAGFGAMTGGAVTGGAVAGAVLCWAVLSVSEQPAPSSISSASGTACAICTRRVFLRVNIIHLLDDGIGNQLLRSVRETEGVKKGLFVILIRRNAG